MIYGISSDDLTIQQKKIDKQKDYLASMSFLSSTGQMKTYLDVSMSANLSERYYAQLTNKVNTMAQVFANDGLMPVFLTITLDGPYQNLHYGDYSKFTLKHQKGLPENDKYGYLQSKASKREYFSVSDLYKLIRYQWSRFTKSYIFKKIKKQHKNIGYLFNTEPHESGVPHSHVLLYIPEEFKLQLLEQFKKSFPAPQNKSKSRKKLTPQQLKNGEVVGFQWTLTNPVGYIMKYVTKSFMDIKNQSQLDELQAWYTKHKIIRITTSHSVVPQWVYRKAYPLCSDWLKLSDILKKGSCEWSKEDDFFIFEDTDQKTTYKYEKGLFQTYQDGELVQEFGEKKEELPSFCQYDKPIMRQDKKKLLPNFVPVMLEDAPIGYTNGHGLIKQIRKLPFQMTDLELYAHWQELDIQKRDYKRSYIANVHNELTKRNFYGFERVNIDHYYELSYAI